MKDERKDSRLSEMLKVASDERALERLFSDMERAPAPLRLAIEAAHNPNWMDLAPSANPPKLKYVA